MLRKMEFAFDVRGVLPESITRVSRDQLPGLRDNQRRDERSKQLATIVNKLGAASAKAQGLRAAVTTFQKLMASSHTLYLLRDDGELPVVVGLLKVGRKRLFLQDLLGVQRETEPLCVLDFYIHETRQRAGLGRRLFQTMLDVEGVRAAELAIDRPSTKFLSFLRKHYSLHTAIKQGNNFVVFSRFFQNANSFSRPVTNNPASAQEQKRIQVQQIIESRETGDCLKPDEKKKEQPPLVSLATSPEKTQPLVSVATPDKIQVHQTLPLSTHDGNFNWSPDTILLRSRRHLQPTPCDIITGVPLPRREKPLPPPSQQGTGRERAPLLTMRGRERHLKGGSRLGFGGPFAKWSQTCTPLGCRLAGEGLAGQGLDSVYSRHSLSSMQPSSHALIRPDPRPHDSAK